MISDTAKVTKDLVLVGAGHAHVAVLRQFGMRPSPGVRITLITREVDTPYSGMLPGLVAGRYAFDEAHIDAGPLARFANARLYQSEAVGLDLAARTVLCRDRPPVPFDLLSLDTGSRPNTGSTPGAAEHAIPVKPIDGFLPRFEQLRARVAEGRSRHVLLVGGGAGGVELLLSVVHRLRQDAPDRAPVFTLVTGSADILPAFPRRFRSRFRAILRQRGVALRLGARVRAVERGGVVLDGGERIAADEVLWTTEAAPAAWLAETGLPLDAAGFLRVDARLRAGGRTDVFAAGDMVTFDPAPVARSGVYAVRAGPVLAANLRAALTGGRLKRYRPQRDALYIVTTGEPSAILTRNGFTAGGDWAWRLKDRIDRRFMARFNDLPTMADGADMRCGGCGAKVGPAMLGRVLGGLTPLRRPEVTAGLDAPDDAAIVDTGAGRLSLQTVDYFRAMIDDPYRFGMIAANHALGDVFAMGGEPQTAQAIATLPYGSERMMEADLAAMMQGANEALSDAGCALVGGHTSEGAELSLGFAVHGQAARHAIIRKSGLRPGDALVLTKPIGTGVLLAAEMRGLAKGRWVQAAIRHMLVSNKEAARVLAWHRVHAMTDVTGFGLLGHLVEMLAASGADALLALDRVPVLDGAREVAAAGARSSMQPQNLTMAQHVRNPDAAQASPLFPLLFDPQTAGGLLAGVAPERAEACVAELREAGYEAAALVGAVRVASGNRSGVSIIDA